MNTNRLKRILPFVAAISLVVFGSCRHEKNELGHHHHSEAEDAGEHAPHDPDHGDHGHGAEEAGKEAGGGHADEIMLSPEKAAKLGVEVTEVSPAQFSEVVTVSGGLTSSPSAQSTVTARSAGIVNLSSSAFPGSAVTRGQTIATVSGEGMAGGDANESARVALAAAKRELDRLTPLHKDGIVSTRDYNAALMAYETAKAAAGNAVSAGSVATAPTSGVVTALMVNQGQYVEAGAPIAQIAASSTLTLRANLPERMIAFLSKVNGARFRTAYSEEVYDISDFNGRRSTDGRSAVAQQGYFPVYFTLSNNGTLSAGSFCEVYLTGESRDGVVSVPVSALSEQQGEYFVYVQVHDDAYDKRPVKLGADAGDRVEILSGLKDGDKVVTSGTTFVRLAETSGAVPEGHSHNH